MASFMNNPNMGAYGAWLDRQAHESSLANNRVDRRNGLEQIATSQQNREFASQTQPLKLEQMGLANQTAQAQLPGIEQTVRGQTLDNNLKEQDLPNQLQQSVLKTQETKQKIAKEQAGLMGQLADQMNMIPGPAQGQFLAQSGLPPAAVQGLMKLPPARRATMMKYIAKQAAATKQAGQMAVNRQATQDGMRRDQAKIAQQGQLDKELQASKLSGQLANTLQTLKVEYGFKKEIAKIAAAAKKGKGLETAKSLSELQTKLIVALNNNPSPEKAAALRKVMDDVNSSQEMTAVLKSGIQGTPEGGAEIVRPGDELRQQLGASPSQIGPQPTFDLGGKKYTKEEIINSIRERNPNATDEQITAKAQQLMK